MVMNKQTKTCPLLSIAPKITQDLYWIDNSLLQVTGNVVLSKRQMGSFLIAFREKLIILCNNFHGT